MKKIRKINIKRIYKQINNMEDNYLKYIYYNKLHLSKEEDIEKLFEKKSSFEKSKGILLASKVLRKGKALKLIKQLLNEKQNNFIKSKIIFALSNIKSKLSLKYIVKNLKSNNKNIKIASIIALSRFTDNYSFNILLKTIKEEKDAKLRQIISLAISNLIKNSNEIYKKQRLNIVKKILLKDNIYELLSVLLLNGDINGLYWQYYIEYFFHDFFVNDYLNYLISKPLNNFYLDEGIQLQKDIDFTIYASYKLGYHKFAIKTSESFYKFIKRLSPELFYKFKEFNRLKEIPQYIEFMNYTLNLISKEIIDFILLLKGIKNKEIKNLFLKDFQYILSEKLTDKSKYNLFAGIFTYMSFCLYFNLDYQFSLFNKHTETFYYPKIRKLFHFYYNKLKTDSYINLFLKIIYKKLKRKKIYKLSNFIEFKKGFYLSLIYNYFFKTHNYSLN